MPSAAALVNIPAACRPRGFMVRDKTTKEPYPPTERRGHQVIPAAREPGAILRPLGDVIVLMPSLAITREELADLLTITGTASTRVIA